MWSAISRKWRKSWQADVDSDAVLVFLFAGDAMAAFGAVVFLFKDFFWYPGPGMLLNRVQDRQEAENRQ